MVSTRVRQSEGPRFKSRSGKIAYFHGVKTRLSTLGTGDVPRGSVSEKNLADIKERLERLESPLPVYSISGIRLGLQWKLRTLDKPFGFLVLKPSWGYMAGIEIRIIFIWVMYSWGCS